VTVMNRTSFRKYIPIIILLVIACGTLGRYVPHTSTLRLTNHGMVPIAVYEQNGSHRLGTVEVGQTECIDLSSLPTENQSLVLKLSASETYLTPPEDLLYQSGWGMDIYFSPRLDVLSLSPEPQCGGK
jgi:hypothetical protein